MAQLDDLRAGLAADSAKVDLVVAAVGGLAKEVADLLGMLQGSPVATDLTAEIAAAASIGARLDSVVAMAAAVPPEPVPAAPVPPVTPPVA